MDLKEPSSRSSCYLTSDGLPQALSSIKNFRSLSDKISIDKYEDVMRPIHLGIIHNGKYVSIEHMKPTEPLAR